MKKFFEALIKVIKHNFWQKLMVILFAFVIWSYILVESNPMRRCEVNDITLSLIGTGELEAKHLIITEGLPEDLNVDIVIETEQNNHKYINSNNVSAYVDVSSINSAGGAVLNVTVDTRYGLVKSVSPATISLKTEPIIERDVPITYEYTGAVAEGYYVAPPQFFTETVSLRGAESMVKRVTEAKCAISVVGLKQTIIKSWNSSLLNYNGNKVDYGNLIIGGAPSISAKIEVFEVKEVPVELILNDTLIENLPEDYEISNVMVNPRSVFIAANKSALDKIDSIAVSSLNIRGKTGRCTVMAPLEIIDGVFYIDTKTVNVTLDIVQSENTKTFAGIPIEVRNANGETNINPQKVDITVSGSDRLLNSLGNSSFKVYVDAKGLKQGTYIIPVRIEDIEGLDMSKVSINMPSISITVQ